MQMPAYSSFSSVSSCSWISWWCLVTKSCPTLCSLMDCGSPGSSFLHYSMEFAQIHVHCISDAIQPSHPLLPLLLLPSVFLNVRVFSSESALRMRWPKYWSFSFSKSSTDIYFPAVLLLHLSNPSRLHMDQFSLSPVIKQFECLSLIAFSNGNHRNFPHCIFNKILFSKMFGFRPAVSWPSLWIADFSNKRA